MKYTSTSYDDYRFRKSVATAMNHIQAILDNTRQPRLAEDEKHTYDDKYALVEFLTNTSIAAQMNALERLGLDTTKMMEVMSWVHTASDTKGKAVTLRFIAEDACQFLMEQEVDMNTGITTEIDVIKASQNEGGGGGGGGGGSLFGGGTANKTERVRTKVITKVKEYHWKVTVGYKIIIFPGKDLSKAIELQKRATEAIIITAAGTGTSGSAQSTRVISPLPERTVHDPIDTKLTWLVQMLSPKEQTCQFSVNRENLSTCKTPCRNDDVKGSEKYHKNLLEWSFRVSQFFTQRVESEIIKKHNPVNKVNSNTSTTQERFVIVEPGGTGIMTGLQKEPTFNGKRVRILEYNKDTQRYRAEPIDPNSGLPATLSIKPANIVPDESDTMQHQGPLLSTINGNNILCPIIPLMEKESVLDMGDVGEFLSEQSRAIDETIDIISKNYPPKQLIKLVSVTEATIVLICRHLGNLTTQYLDSVDYIENLLKVQLVQAIGKEVTSYDFEQFMRFHCRKLFRKSFTPCPFSYAIRRPGFYPEGILTIESKASNTSGCFEALSSSSGPVETFQRKVAGNAGPSMFIPLDAASSVEITGDRYLHGWMQHRFQSESPPEFNLACRARQFSCFIVLVGTLRGPDIFDAKDAIIVQNKDEVLIPLLTDVLPSAKEFNDAIASLSPEQQQFAKAFRGMQLESSVFGVCVIQIKPQLEKLLGLPDCALTKEIQLTQDLLSLFVDYQIPSDLLSFSTAIVDSDVESVTTDGKIRAVRGYVKAVMDVIDGSKQKQLKEEEMKADMRAEMSVRTRPAPTDEESSGYRLLSMNLSASGGDKRHGRRLKASPHAIQEARATQDVVETLQVAVPLQSQVEMGATRQLSQSLSLPTKTFVGEDFTLLPKLLDATVERHDTDGALRSTIVKVDVNWTRMRQANLLVAPSRDILVEHETKNEKKKAFDLLDAISRSGTLAIDCSELHVVVAVSHCFDNDIMGSVIEDNINPIEKVERSSLLLASAISGLSPTKLIEDDENKERLSNTFPMLFDSRFDNQVLTSGPTP